MTEYSQGVCQDGAAILKDSQMMTIEEILEDLRCYDGLIRELRTLRDSHGNQEAYVLLRDLSAHNGGEG